MDSIRFKLIAFFLLAAFLTATAREWIADRLTDDGFQTTTIDQPDDYSGRVVTTVIRKDCPEKTDMGVLYVHGFNDYFFQTEFADKFVEKGFNFYAVDLRKYGRSVLPGQKMFEVRNLKEYFADLDSAFSVMRENGNNEIILLGHSTGGLITSYYMALQPPADVRALILNSPFLAWNLSKFNETLGVPIVSTIGSLYPRMKIKQPGGTAYSESLLKGEHGEWTYDTSLKLSKSPDVTAGWINAINSAQLQLHAMVFPIGVPILLMHSDKSVSGDQWSPEHNRGDGVLDVNDIARYGLTLGIGVTEFTVRNGLHDLVLSAPEVRYPLYKKMFQWIADRGL